MAPFETTNAEFRQFLNDGYGDDANWTEEGKRWRASHRTESSAALRPGDAEYERFGQSGQPAVNLTWYEANAYCHWLTTKFGRGTWIFSLPTDAEWEKAARGPDNFDYGLSMTVSDQEVPLYNWKKNPEVPVTVVDTAASRAGYVANRYGLYHMSGNVAEWTQSIFRPYGRDNPYADDDRNHDDTPGRRTVRGGSWYSATTAPLYLPYRDAFQPDHSNNDLGFRVVARAVMCMELVSVRTIAAQELKINVRNKWTLVFGLIFAALALAISYFGLVTEAVVGFQGFTRTTASLLNLVLYLIPMISLRWAHSVSPAREVRASYCFHNQ